MNVAEIAARVAEPLRAPPLPAGRHLRVVDEAARRRSRRLRIAVWVFGAVTAASVFVAVAFHVALAQSEFQLNRLSAATAVAQRDYERARLEVADLGSPARIMAGATELGMVYAPNRRVVSLAADASAAPPSSGDETSEPGTDSSQPASDWRKVKPHLGTQP